MLEEGLQQLFALTAWSNSSLYSSESIWVKPQLPDGRSLARLPSAPGSNLLKVEAGAPASSVQATLLLDGLWKAAISIFAFLTCQHLKPSIRRTLPQTAEGGRKG